MPAPDDPSARDAADWGRLQGRTVELLRREDLRVSRAPTGAEIVRGLGFDVNLVYEREIDLSADRIVFIGGNPIWYRRTLERIAALPREQRPVVIVWHTEPLPMPPEAGFPRERLTTREVVKIVLRDRRVNDHYSNARYLEQLDRDGSATVLAVATGAYQAFLAGRRVHADFVPVGYHEGDGRLLGLERDIDAVFLGDYRIRRRRRILRRVEREGIDIQTLGSNTPEKGYWGDARTELLNRTKIMLNIPRLPGHLPDIRLIVGMANGALVVSEPMYLPAPYVPGEHYVEATVDELAETVRCYLDDEDARRRITSAAHRFVTEGLTLEGSFRQLFRLASERSGSTASARAVA